MSQNPLDDLKEISREGLARVKAHLEAGDFESVLAALDAFNAHVNEVFETNDRILDGVTRRGADQQNGEKQDPGSN